MSTSSRRQARNVKTVSIDLLAMLAALLWIAAILVVSIFAKGNTPFITWAIWGIGGAMCVYVGAFLSLHIYAKIILDRKEEKLSGKAQKKSSKAMEAEPAPQDEHNIEEKEMVEGNGTEQL